MILKVFTICLSNNSKVVFELKKSSGLKGEGMDISTIAAQLVKEKVISHYPTSVKVLNGERQVLYICWMKNTL